MSHITPGGRNRNGLLREFNSAAATLRTRRGRLPASDAGAAMQERLNRLAARLRPFVVASIPPDLVADPDALDALECALIEVRQELELSAQAFLALDTANNAPAEGSCPVAIPAIIAGDAADVRTIG